MSHICERRVVHCPSREASRYLAAFVAAQRAGGLTAHIELRVPIRVFSDRLPAIELRVFAAFHSLHAVSDPHPTYSISWSSKGVPFPEFAGALAVEQGLNDDCFGLVLSGHYDLPFGRLRMRAFGGSGGHNGLKSIIEVFGEGFPRLRVGIGRPANDAIDAVLSAFTPEEENALPAIIEKAADGVVCWLERGAVDAMNVVNPWQPPESLPSGTGP